MNGEIALANQHFWLAPEDQGLRQPLFDDATGIAITCHARLDNRQDLLDKLAIDQRLDSSINDAALIILAYRKWKYNCVEHLLGDFAIALWDSREKTLFLARDALGMGDICYYLTPKFCLVASEVKQILAHPAVKSRVNEYKLALLLTRLPVDHGQSFYEDINYLPPAHCMVIGLQGEKCWRYWDIDPESKIRYRSDREYAGHFLELLTEAVRCRLRVAGEIGISLSGGKDSSSIAALATSILTNDTTPSKELHSFSYVFDNYPDVNERPFIQKSVDQFGLQAYYLSGDDYWPLKCFPDFPIDADSPIQEPYIQISQLILGAARQSGCRLMLMGLFDSLYTGGDYWVADMLRELRWRELGRSFINNLGSVSFRSDVINHGIWELIPMHIKRLFRRFIPRNLATANPVLDSDLALRTGVFPKNHELFAKLGERYPAPGQLHRYLALLYQGDDLDVGLRRQLANSFGVEYVSPYMDRRLVEFIMAVPADQLHRPGQYKFILRNAMQGLLPDSVRQSSQLTSLNAFFDYGLKVKERQVVLDIFRQPQILERRLVNPGWLQKALEMGETWEKDAYPLWICLCLELWLRKFG